MLSTRMPAASRARTTAVASPGEVVDGGVQDAAVVADLDPSFDQLLQGGDGVRVGGGQGHLQACPLARFLELARRALGDHACRDR